MNKSNSLTAGFIFFLITTGLSIIWPSEPTLILASIFLALIVEQQFVKFHIVNPILLTTLAYILIYMLPVFWGDVDLDSYVIRVLTIGLMALTFGCLIGYIYSSRFKKNIPLNISTKKFNLKFIPILFIGLTCLLTIIISWLVNPALLTETKGANQFSMSRLDQISASFAMLLPGLSTIIAIYFFKKKTLTNKYFSVNSSWKDFIFIFLFFSPILYDFLTAGRSHTVSTVISSVVAYSVYIGRISSINAFLIALGIGLFSSLMIIMRGGMTLGINGLADAFNALQLEESFSLIDSIHQASMIGHQPEIVSQIISYSDTTGYQYGESYFKTLINVIPLFHIMYDDTFPPGVLYKMHFASNDVTGFDFAGIAEMYLQGGIISVISSQILLGFTLTNVYYTMFRNKKVTNVLLYSGLIFGTIWWFRSDLLNFMRHIENFLIIYLVYRGISRLALKTKFRMGLI